MTVHDRVEGLYPIVFSPETGGLELKQPTINDIHSALEKAVAEERERCIKIVKVYINLDILQQIEDTIRENHSSRI